MAKGATNIIPYEVKLEGTFRTMNEKWRFEAHEHIEKIVKGIAEGMGGTVDLDIRKGYPTLTNDNKLTYATKQRAIDFLGAENVVDLPIRMTAEDFSYYSQEMPAVFYRLGTGNKAKGITSPVHTPTFNIDEDALELSTGLMAWLAIQELSAERSNCWG
jgi:metal-dependent amidase/aminoacylase/carboxypeptidase family protein